ncbi:MAG: transcription-repair coupling factor [Acidobacteria bacterium]|nr:transcription-repair coupling factor [Acidobacteriota bacterium]
MRALLKTAASRVAMGVPGRKVTGLPPSAQAFFAAAAAREGLTILVVSSDGDVERMTADAQFFYGGLEGIGTTDIESAVLAFPSHEIDPYRGLAPHLDVASARARALLEIASGRARLVVASAAALLPRVSDPEAFLKHAIQLKPGDEISPVDLRDLLVAAGFSHEDPVDEHGEFCQRGGVVDLFPAGEVQPIRIEFIGDTIESIRRYDPATQRSVMTLDRAGIVPLRERLTDGELPRASVMDFVSVARRSVLLLSEEDDVWAQATRVAEQIDNSYQERVSRGDAVPPPDALIVPLADVERWLAGATRLEELAIDEGAAIDEPREATHAAVGARHIACQPAVELRGRVTDWVAEIRRARARGETVVFVAATAGRAERTLELLGEHEIVAVPVERAEEIGLATVLVATGQLSRGFRLAGADLQLYAETDVFDEERRVHERRKSQTRSFLSDFRDLKVGDHIVHVDHGIGVFAGLRRIDVGLQPQEFMELRYAGDDKLFVPVERLDLVQKYSGAAKPTLDRLGGASWERAKTRVRKAMRDMAGELLKLYAARKAITGHAFAPDSHWQQEFEDAFDYELTADQQAAIAEIKRDMEAPSPMDRLLCGDVGYGKTEVAMRAAFKVVMDGKQVAFLAPTTVLAFQHVKTLKDRFAGFPVRIDMVSRFRSKAEQKAILADLADGKVDIIVGTHRLLSSDVRFRDLGLLVVDEEQRFGVAHKEKVKQLRRRVDVLTMTATPIPRTLNMSLVGIRDMSIIETPPKDRLAIQTNVVKFDQHVIARAIRNELSRRGQVFFVHNRVDSIDAIGHLITRLVPEARVAIAHGQMSEGALERVMVDFVARQYDVLLATTIIENGLDIPNANTMVVNRADRYGLAELYQLRGRVGRSDRRAYAYLLVPPEDSLSPIARKRLAAIREFSDLGSGFRIAALDLEIRGAGNLLGGEQSGQIEAIGFELYMKLLEQTARELKGEEIEEEVRTAVNLRVDLRIDETYIPDMNQRLMVYRRIAAVRSESELARELDDVRDRYGPPPPSVLNLGEYGRIRVMADRLGVESIDRDGRQVVLKFRQDATVDPSRIIGLVRRRPDVALTPPAVLKLDLAHAGTPSPVGGPRRPDHHPSRSRGAGRREDMSWWTARATSGEVTSGFSKQEILRPVPEDPRAPGGVFTRVSSLLAELSEGW